MSIPNIKPVPGLSAAQETVRDVMGFGTMEEYVSAGFYNARDKFLTYPKLIARRWFKTKNLHEMQEDALEVTHGKELKRTLGAFDLTCLGVGFMCGAGIFVGPGYIAGALTGPALFIAYLVASLSAFLSSFCYAEFTVSIPMAGAAYNYIYATLGEVIAWITVSNLILEYLLSNAAAARGFAPYLAVLFNKDSSFFLRNWNGYILDGWSCGLTVVCTALLAVGIKESATANNIITCVHVLVMFFIIIAGLTKANRANFKPFIRKGSSWKQIFNGAAICFFSYIGFDALATTAEEMKEPAKDMPLGILGAVATVTVIYTLMCITLSLAVPNGSIDQNAAFASLFDYVGMTWAKYIVSIGALLGIFTTTLIGVLGCSRILCGCCRERMLPQGIAWVNSRGVPIIATIIVGGCSAGIALFSSFAELSNMISIGTFVVFWMVAVGLLWFRCNVPGKTTLVGQGILLLHTLAIIGFSMAFTIVWVYPTYADYIPGYYIYDYGGQYGYTVYRDPITEGPLNHNQGNVLIAMAVLYVASTFSMWWFCKQDFVPQGYKVPLFPFVPSLSIFVNTFLLGQLDMRSYERFGWWTLASMCIYFVYGAVAQEAFETRLAAKHAGLPVVEMSVKVVEGKASPTSSEADAPEHAP